MAKKQKINNDEQEKVNMEKMQKRVESLLPAKADIPASISIQQAEELKARISELETELAQQKTAYEKMYLHPASAFDSQLQQQTEFQVKRVILSASEKDSEEAEGNEAILKKIQRFFSSPIFPEDEDKTRRAGLLHVILVAQIYVLLLVLAGTLISTITTGATPGFEMIVMGIGLLLIIFWRFLMWRRLVGIASTGMIFFFTLSVTMILASGGTIRSAGIIFFPLTVVMATLLINRRAGLITFILTSMIGIGLIQGEIGGILPKPDNATSFASNAIVVAGMGLTTVLLYLATRGTDNALKRARENEQQIRSLASTLELRVADRTHDLELASEIGRAITEKMEDVSTVLTEATEMIRSRFNLYYTQVYLLDRSGQTITLRAGTGDAGKQLLQRGHHLLVSSGSLNGRAVSEKKPVIVADTEKSNSFLPNPLLPRTRSEMAIPLLIGDKVLGVLDMQSETPDALNEDNIAAFQVLAGQLSVAIQNAILFTQSEEARKQVEENVRQITRAGWQDFLNGVDRSERVGYAYNQTEIRALDNLNEVLAPNSLDVPINILGEKIGSIQVIENKRSWSLNEAEILQATAAQLAQHIENLRLLSQAEQYRGQAEQIARRLTHESWDGFIQERKQLADGYVYDLTSVQKMYESTNGSDGAFLPKPILVHDEIIGEIAVETSDILPEEYNEILIAVASQLGSHIENLRLLEETEIGRNELQQGEARLRTLIENAPEAIVVVDLTTGLFADPNENAMKIYGLSREELIKVGPAQMSPSFQPDGRDSTEKAMEKIGEAMQGGAPVFEWIHRNAQGIDFPCEIRLVRLLGERPLVRASVTDITERKKAQDTIARRAAELQTVATVSTTASTALNPDELLQAVVDLTKERFNLYHAHIYLADESWNTLLLASGAGEVGRQMVATGHAIQMNAEKSLVARASRERTAVIANDVRVEAGFLPNPLLPETRSEMAVPMIVGDKVIGVFDVQSDKTTQFTDEDVNIYTTLAVQVAITLQNARLYQEQSATVTQLRELDRLKSSFLANMSHELRTPLNSILGFADVMLEELDGPLTENMSNDLGLIHKNGQHLLHLINDVLDMAKIDSGKLNLSVEQFNLQETIEEVVSITSPLANEKNLALVIEPDSDHEVEINADKIRVRQVMINLINNAMKFTEKGNISIRVVREENNVLISVKDNGIGIPVDHLESVFQEFTQVDTSTTRKTGGTGLGLPISRRLIEMHSGRLWAESTGIDGEGSTFYIFLPIESKIKV